MEKEKPDLSISDRDDIDERRPRPYRYVSDESDLKTESGEQNSCSVMSDEKTSKPDVLAKTFETTLGIGDMDAVEQVLKKHEKQRSEMK